MKLSFFNSKIQTKNLTNKAFIRTKFILIIRVISNIIDQKKILLIFLLKLRELIMCIFNRKSTSTMFVLLNLFILRYFILKNI